MNKESNIGCKYKITGSEPEKEQKEQGAGNLFTDGLTNTIKQSKMKFWVGLSIVFCFLIASPAFPDLNDGLVAYYPFDGDANDASGNGHNGTVYGASLTDFGKYGGAYGFDSLDDYITIGTGNELSIEGEWTISGWARIYDNERNYIVERKILGYEDRVTLNYSLYIDEDSLNVKFGDGTNRHILSYSLAGLDKSEWHLYTATWDSAHRKLSLYLDGSLVESSTFNAEPIALSDGETETWIGRHWGIVAHNIYFNGIIDEVRIYDRALDPAEVESLYSADGDGDGLPNDWEEKHFGGTTAADPDSDPDNDGYTNIEEFQNETNPKQFDIGPIRIWMASKSTIGVDWHSVPGTNYQVQWMSSLQSNDWDNVGSVTAEGESCTIFDSAEESGAKIYRVIVP